MKLNFNHIKNEILSPGNIFWKKSNGVDLLISKKGEVLNFELIKKITDAGYDLVLEDSIDLAFYDSLFSLYVKYSEELLMKNKMKWRLEIIESLITGFIKKKKSQFELNHLARKLFSQFNNSEITDFIARDNDLFIRNASIASSYAFCAFLLGYYESSFLSNLFTSTFKNLMELGNGVELIVLKEKIEHLRMQDSFTSLDYKFIEELASPVIIKSTMIFERYDGSGIRKINSREMNDLEIVFVAINRSFGIGCELNDNILSQIKNETIVCISSILKMLQKILYKDSKTAMKITG